MECTRINPLIEFPCVFPIKIMGVTDDGFAQTIGEVVKQHDPSFDIATLEIRASAKGNYLGLTATVNATSQEQLDKLYIALSSHPMVKIVI